MSFLSSIKRRLGRKGGKRGSGEKKIRQQTDQFSRFYNTSTPDALIDSLDDDQKRVLKAAYDSIRANATPFNSVRPVRDQHGNLERYEVCANSDADAILSSVNYRGQTREMQSYRAVRKIAALGLPEEVLESATKFAVDYVDAGMNGKAPQEDSRASC
jgi:hypothetical protein